MAEVKGRWIQLSVDLMRIYPAAQRAASELVERETGVTVPKLNPDGWYSTKLFDAVMRAYANAALIGDEVIVVLGKSVYPTIKALGAIPPTVKNAFDLICFEADGFMANHRGAEVKPRRFIKKEPNHVVVVAEPPGYNAKLYEGVFLGILEMYGFRNGKVEQRPGFEFHITW